MIFQDNTNAKNINGIYLQLQTLAEVKSSNHKYQQTFTIPQQHIQVELMVQSIKQTLNIA